MDTTEKKIRANADAIVKLPKKENGRMFLSSIEKYLWIKRNRFLEVQDGM